MKTIFTTVILIISATALSAQSDTFITLRDKFRGQENVLTFSTSGVFARALLFFAGEHDFREAIARVQSISMITVPKKAFEEANVSVGGLKKLARKESFEEMIRIQDHGDDVTVFVREGKHNRSNRYFILIDDSYELVAIEIKGYIDPECLNRNSQLSYYE